MLAMVLVKRHNISIKEKDVYFPISESKDLFDRNAKKLLDGLPPLEQRLLVDLKPYHGGNEIIWALHRLDILRKHRRLLNARLKPIHMSLVGALNDGDFTPLGGDGSIQVGEETVLGMLRKGVPAPALHTSFYVAIDEEGIVASRPVTAVLAKMASTATLAINLFDY